MTANKDRVVFLDYLRAFACVLVVFGHVCFLGLNGYEAFAIFVPGVEANIFGPDSASRNVFTGPSIWLAHNTGITVGGLGVGIFFIISGYLIAGASERETTTAFAIKRFFRIFPTLAAAAALTWSFTYIYCFFAGQVSPHTIISSTVSVLLMNAFTGHIDAVPVLWTLRVEVVFYVMIALAARFGAINYRSVLIIALFCAGYTIFVVSPYAAILITPSALYNFSVLTLDSSQIIFIMIGSVIWISYRRGEAARGFGVGLLIFLIFVGTQWAIVRAKGHLIGGVDNLNGAWAVAFFLAALWSGMKWRWIEPLKHVANISYPLYVVHVPLAWIMLSVFGRAGLTMLPATIATWCVVLIVAVVVHKCVERPTQEMGSNLAKRR